MTFLGKEIVGVEYGFAEVAITNSHKLGSLKQQKSQIKVLAGPHPLWRLQGEACFSQVLVAPGVPGPVAASL